jgi:hypothetical protein
MARSVRPFPPDVTDHVYDVADSPDADGIGLKYMPNVSSTTLMLPSGFHPDGTVIVEVSARALRW